MVEEFDSQLSKKDIGKSLTFGVLIALTLCGAYEAINQWRAKKLVDNVVK